MLRLMKKWVEKLREQFDFDISSHPGEGHAAGSANMSEEGATLLYIIDIFNKHMIEVEGHPVRKVRETLDEYAKELLNPKEKNGLERVLFRFRQFFGAYRMDETAYINKTFEDFRTIIWEFVDQLSDDIGKEQKEDFEIRQSLDELKEAVESNSIDVLKNQSRKFIDCYVEKQFKKDKRRNTRLKSIRKNMNVMKKQLGEAKDSARVDHLTQAYNRKTFDDYLKQHHNLFQASNEPVSLLMVDIDHFKRINDTFGHAIGDFVLTELVKTLKSMFTRESDLLARIGGEEFAIILPAFAAEHAMKKAEEVLHRVRSEAYVHEEREIRFTVSIGVAQLCTGEEAASWMKRADLALYNSKNTGRNKATLAAPSLTRVA
jgi:diguanylate cyclase